MMWCCCRTASLRLILPILLIVTLVGAAGAQGAPQLSGQEASFIPAPFGEGGTPSPFLSLGSRGGSCGDPSGERDLGILGAGYNYYSFPNARVNFSEARFLYTLPLLLDNGDAVRPYVLVRLNGLKDPTNSQDLRPAFGLANTILRFGGSWRSQLGKGFWVGAQGEYDATRRQHKWYSGGRAAIELFESFGSDNASLRVTYYAGSAGDNLIFSRNSNGYGVDLWYAHDLFAFGPRLMLWASGYEYNNQTQGIGQRGWLLGASLRFAGGLFSVRGTAGRDSVILNNYSVGGYCTLAF